MEVSLLDSIEKKTAVLEAWKRESKDSNSLGVVEDEVLSTEASWYLVKTKDLGINLAVFDVRKIPLASAMQHKTLRIHFAPSVDLDMDGQNLETAEADIIRVASILSTAFNKMLECAEETTERMCKIYCHHKQVHLLFLYFAKSLAATAPEKYSVKLYSRWIEIKLL